MSKSSKWSLALVPASALLASCGVLFPLPTSGGGAGHGPQEVSESGPGPQQPFDYARNADDLVCSPSCYEPEPAEAKAPPARGCGYHLWLAREAKLGESSWAKVKAGPYSFADNGAAPFPCDQFPAPQSQWKHELADVRAQIAELKPNDVVIAEPGTTDWSYETNDRQEVIARTINLRVYQHDIDTIANPCGSDPLLFCEKGRSVVATAMNFASFHLAEADKLAAAGKKNGCRQAAWDVVAAVENARLVRKTGLRDSTWVPNARYALRDGRTLDESALFAALDDTAAKATGLFQKCGGTGEPPLRDDDKFIAQQALKHQRRREADGIVRPHEW